MASISLHSEGGKSGEIPARLRAKTTMTMGWFAERLAMGSRSYLNHLLYHQRKSGGN
jgi:hypothetical protein